MSILPRKRAKVTNDGVVVRIPTTGTPYHALGLEVIDDGQTTYTASVTVSGDRAVIGSLNQDMGCTIDGYQLLRIAVLPVLLRFIILLIIHKKTILITVNTPFRRVGSARLLR